MKIKIVDFNNYKDAIKIQHEIFPNENATLNILASLDRNLFMKLTGMYYEDDKVKYYIAYINNKQVGITGLYQYQDDEAWIGWFGILPEYRNKGYGKILLKETIDLAKKLGYKIIRLYTDKKENKEAIKLYKKVGFIGEKYSVENLSYDCWIFSKGIYDDKVNLWNNRNLNLAYQSELDQIDSKKAKEIFDMYEKLDFKEANTSFLFVYGSLKSKKVQKELFGRELKSYSAELRNYALYEAEDGFYFIKESSKNIIQGYLLEIDNFCLKICDAFEECPKMYQRKLVSVYSNGNKKEAYVYIRLDDVGEYKKVENYNTYSRLNEDDFIKFEVRPFKEKEHPEFYKKIGE